MVRSPVRCGEQAREQQARNQATHTEAPTTYCLIEEGDLLREHRLEQHVSHSCHDSFSCNREEHRTEEGEHRADEEDAKQHEDDLVQREIVEELARVEARVRRRRRAHASLHTSEIHSSGKAVSVRSLQESVRGSVRHIRRRDR